MSRKFEGNEGQPQEDDTLGSYYMGRMRPPPENGRVLPRGLVASVVVLAFIGIIWYAYPSGDDTGDAADVPVISADTAAYKFKPEDPGGMEIRHQDSTVFNPLVKKNADEVEHLLPTTEEPLDKADALKAEDTKSAAKPLDMQLEKQDGAEKVVTTEEADAAKAKADAAAKADADKKPTLTELATKTVPVAKPETPAEAKEEAKPVEKPAAKEDSKTADSKTADTKAAPAAAGAAGGFYMQLGAFREAPKAQDEWRKLQKKFPQSLSKLSSRVERADLGAKGVWYRLYAGPAPESSARDICTRLKADGTGCMVRKL